MQFYYYESSSYGVHCVCMRFISCWFSHFLSKNFRNVNNWNSNPKIVSNEFEPVETMWALLSPPSAWVFTVKVLVCSSSSWDQNLIRMWEMIHKVRPTHEKFSSPNMFSSCVASAGQSKRPFWNSSKHSG